MERETWVVLFFGGEKKKTTLGVWAPKARASCNRKTPLYGVFFDEREKERKKERKTAVVVGPFF